MSRSVHATVKNRRDPGDLGRKRRIKYLIALEREKPTSALPHVSADAVPIVVRDLAGIVYPASEQDLRALLGRLPADAASGVRRIELSFERTSELFDIVDGLREAGTLGRYHPSGELFVLGYERAAGLEIPTFLTLYLRTVMLCTFVHELGHHHDAQRMARGRWRSDDDDLAEMYAEAFEHEWTHAYVLPHIEETYPAELHELESWVERHGGRKLSLGTLLGDPRSTRDGDTRTFCTVGGAFRRLLADVRQGKSVFATRLAFAKELHWAAHHDDALAILEKLGVEDPANVDILVLSADIMVKRGDFNQGLETIATLPRTLEVLKVVRNAHFGLADWSTTLEAALAIVPLETGDLELFGNLETIARSHIELGDLVAGEADVAELLRTTRSWRVARARVMEARLALKRGDLARALTIADELIEDERSPSEIFEIRAEITSATGSPK